MICLFIMISPQRTIVHICFELYVYLNMICLIIRCMLTYIYDVLRAIPLKNGEGGEEGNFFCI